MIELAATAVLISLAACAPLPPQPPRVEPAEVIDSAYDPVVAVKSQEEWYGNIFGVPEFSWRLYSAYDKKTGTVLHSVLLSNFYSGNGWRFWSNASNNQAEALPFSVVHRRVVGCGVRGCSYSELVSADLTQAQMDAGTRSGIRLRFSSQGYGDWYTEFTAEEVREHLRRFAGASAKYRRQ